MRGEGVLKTKTVVVGACAGVVLLTGLFVFLFVSSYRALLEEAFLERSVAYAAAFSDAAGSWLEGGDPETARAAARFLLLGSVLYVQVVSGGRSLVDERAERADSLDLSPLFAPPSARTARLDRLDRGLTYLDVVVPRAAVPDPRGPSPPGYVRIGIDATSVRSRARAAMLLAAGLGALFDLLIIGGFLLLVRRAGAHARVVGMEARPLVGGPSASLPITVGALEVDEGKKEVRLSGRAVALTPKQYAVLHLLVSEPGRVFSDREIVAAVWPDSAYADSKDVKQQVYLLRRRLAEVDAEGAKAVANVPGFGYRLVPPGVDEDLTGA